MRNTSLCIVSALALVLSVSTAPAQSIAENAASSSAPAPGVVRSGFFVGGGLGLGSAQLNCGPGCGSNSANGLSGNFHIGGTINPHFRVGLETNGWVHSENGVDSQVGFFTGAVYLYPSVHNNLWLKGGVGYALAKATDNVDELKADGVGLSAAIGYDWAVTQSNFVIVPYAGYLRLMNGSSKFDGTDLGVNSSVELFQFGIGLGFRH